MKRQLCLCALFALVLVPDWASARWPRGEPVYYYPCAPVYYAPPVYCQPVYVQPCLPVNPPMLAPPRIEPVKPRAGSSLDAPRSIAQPNPPAPVRPAEIEPVRPAANVETPKLPKIDVAPAPKPTEPEPKAPKLDFPTLTPEPKQPVIELPKVDEPKLPPLELPKDTGSNPKLPPLELPGVPAIPVPAPAPDSLIPPSALPVPKTADTLPPLTLPPDTPVSPDAKPVEAKSSPLAAVANGVKVSVFPASGVVAANGVRKVGFYNHTDRDLSLTIEGKAVALPAKTYILAHLPPTFTWKHGDKPATKETVPADAAGIDVLFKE